MDPATTWALISAAISVVERTTGMIQKMRQSAALTPEQDRELDERLRVAFESDAWKTDDQLRSGGTGTGTTTGGGT